MDKFQNIYKALEARRLYQALRLLYGVQQEVGTWSLRERRDGLEQNYRYLIDYFAKGGDDPNRTQMLGQMLADGLRLTDQTQWLWRGQHANGLWRDMRGKAKGYTADEDKYNRLRGLFYGIWIDDEDQWEVPTDEMTAEEAMMVVSALVVVLADRFSERKMLQLLGLVRGGMLSVAAEERAMVGIVLLWMLYERRLFAFPQVEKALQGLVKEKGRKREILEICGYLLNTALTKKANREMENMHRDLTPEVEKKGGKHLLITLDEMDEENPNLDNETEAIVGKYIDRVGRLHERGADFNYATTRVVLSDGFFQQDIANWFMPFGTDNKDIGVDFESEKGKLLLGLIYAGAATCELDKYAMSRLYHHIEEQLDENLPSVIKDKAQFGEADAEEKMQDKDRLARAAVREYYRFFENNPWGIRNVMTGVTGVCRSELFHRCCSRKQVEPFIDHCLSLNLWEDAERLCKELAEADVTVSVWQKWGYALQREKRFEEALDIYRKARVIEDSVWLQEHEAQCLRKLDRLEETLQVYEGLLETDGENKAYLEQQALCLMELGRAQEALQVFYKLSLLFEGDRNVERGLGWCAFVCGKIDVAYQYLEKVAYSDDAQDNDYLNYGHLLLTMGHREEALDMYKRSRGAAQKLSDFLRLLRKDYPILSKNGVEHEVFALMEEAVTMTSD